MGMLQYAWDKNLPILAVCLGLQELNVLFGGDLYQDIPTQLEGKEIHRIEDWYDARHDVRLEPESLIRKVVGIDVINVNSAHHQAIRKVSPKFRVTASAHDGIIEALQPVDAKHPVLAVQWHPEMEENDAVGLNLFKWIVTEAQKSK
jgi:putative glutamine amidotransferase